MKKRDWVIQQYENVSDFKDLFSNEMYDKYCRETDSDATFASYRRYLYSIKDSLFIEDLPIVNDEEDEDQEDDLPIETDHDFLMSLLEDEVVKTNRRLMMSDIVRLAKENGFKSESFSRAFPDLKSILSDVYRIAGLELAGDIDSMKLKRKIKVLKSEVDALKNQSADYSQLVDILEDVVSIYTPLEAPNVVKSKEAPDRAMVALFSDLHAGELVSLEETHGLNEYNQSIMTDRIDSFFNQVIRYADELGLNILHLKMLGDMINGEIHEELIRNSDLDTVESLILISDYTSQWLRNLTEHFDEIHVLGISGNHGRFSKKPNFKKMQTLNFDYLAYEFMRRETENIVTSFELPKSPFVIREIKGHKFLTTHGNIFKGGTGLNPVSGTWGRDIEKMKGLFQSEGGFEYAEFAHFHTPILDIPSFSGVSMIVNGAVKGADEFSVSAVKAGSRPSQIVYTVERGEGVKFRTTLFLD